MVQGVLDTGAGRRVPTGLGSVAPWIGDTIGRRHLGRLQLLAFICTGMMAFSGSVKQAIPISIPVDFTVASTSLSLGLGVVYMLAAGSWPGGRMLAVLSLLLVMTLAGAATYVPTLYGERKVDRLFIITLLAVLAAILPVKNHRDAYRLIQVMAGVAFVLSLWIVSTGEQQYGDGGRLTSQLGSTIAFGRAAGFVLVIVLAWLMTARNLTFIKLLAAAAVVVVEIWTMLAIASRGPIQAVVVAAIVMIVPLLWRSRIGSAWKVPVMIAGFVGALVAVWSAVPERSRMRITQVAGDSSEARERAWELTWGRLGASPLGSGWGSWADQPDVDGLNYPHMFLLEVWFEAGAIGLLAMLAGFWISTRHQLRVHNVDSAAATAALGGVTFWAASAMVSGDMNDNKVLWMVLVASAAPIMTEKVRAAQRAGPAMPGTSLSAAGIEKSGLDGTEPLMGDGADGPVGRSGDGKDLSIEAPLEP